MRSGDVSQGVMQSQRDIAGQARHPVRSQPKELRQTIKIRNQELDQQSASLPSKSTCSITFECGTEFRAWQHLENGLGVEPWF
jgi:IS30 family transposase